MRNVNEHPKGGASRAIRTKPRYRALVAIDAELRRIAAETGGLAFVVNGRSESESMGPATDEIISELDNQYVLGFSVPPWSANVLPVELMLPHYPGLRVRAPRVVRFRPDDLFRPLSTPPAQILPE